MIDRLTLDGLAPAVRESRDRFSRLVEPHRPDLWAYCLRLTGSPWEAEDLAQETLLRAFARLANYWQPLEMKPYLFRIASNTWIDSLRRARVQLDPLTESVDLPSESAAPSAAEMEEAMAALLHRLPPRQRVIYLLIDTLGFTAAEVAGMVSASTGAIKAALHRARASLAESTGRSASAWIAAPRDLPPSDRAILDRFVAALNERDAEALVALLDERASTDIVGQAEELGREVIRRQSVAGAMKDPTPQVAEAGVLAGEHVVLIYALDEGGDRRLRWMLRLEMSGGRICRVHDYFFTPELIRFVASNLGVPAAPFGYYFSSTSMDDASKVQAE